jgi:HNH endonuclease
MCRGMRDCTELGSNPTVWSKDAPLMPPNWFDGQLTIFNEAVQLAALGDTKNSREKLRSIRGEELQTWYIEHGQQSGVFRNRHIRLPKPNVTVPLDPVGPPDRFAKAVFMRDGYRCRYCCIRLVPKEVLMAFSKIVGSDVFRPTGKNCERHGIVLIFRANADHVLPWTLGGRTDMENLVSSCWCCNYGKSNFTLNQIGVDDPRCKPISTSDAWDGLTSYLPALKANAARPA